MSKINFEDIQENYKTALAEKEANTQDVVTAIVDNDLIDKFTLIQKEKEQISSIEDLSKYQKNIKSFFDDVYKIITAPGVQKFIDWLDELSSKGLEAKNQKQITELLIKDYASYDDNIKNIIKNKDVVRPNNSLFENIKKSVKENIIKRIASSFTSKEKVESEFPEFIEELDDLMEGLSKIEELGFKDVKDFYTLNLDKNGDEDYKPEIDTETDFYHTLLKQVVQKKDFLTTDQVKIELSKIVEDIQNSIEDIYSTIEVIKTINVSCNSAKEIQTIYNKFESSFKLQNIDNFSEHFEDSINTIWDKIINAYNSCQVFYSNNSEEKNSKLNDNKDKWESLSFKSKIEQYVLTLHNIITDNPIKSINSNDISKIKTIYTKVEKEINSLEENNPKDDIVNYFSNITSDFEIRKIEILKKLKTDNSKIKEIEDAIKGIDVFIKNIEKADNLLDALNEDFVEGILESYDYIKKEFKSAIDKSDIKDELKYLEEISSDECVLNKTDLEDNIKRYKRLLEYDLINIKLTKNI